MKHLLTLFVLFLLTPPSFSQSSKSEATELLSFEDQRGRIQAERSREEGHFKTEEEICYTKFAVSDCLRGVRLRRRELLVELRRKEIGINDQERLRKAQSQIDQIKKKSLDD
jgi:hypothetical protein